MAAAACWPYVSHADGPSNSVEIPVTMNEMLLRGCMLRNTEVTLHP